MSNSLVLPAEAILTLPPLMPLYHHSRSLARLLACNYFDSSMTQNDGAMYFTPSPTVKTNCVASSEFALRLLDVDVVSEGILQDLDEACGGNYWEGAASFGFDGRVKYLQDPYTTLHDDTYCNEIVIFRDSLSKLTRIDRYELITPVETV